MRHDIPVCGFVATRKRQRDAAKPCSASCEESISAHFAVKSAIRNNQCKPSLQPPSPFPTSTYGQSKTPPDQRVFNKCAQPINRVVNMHGFSPPASPPNRQLAGGLTPSSGLAQGRLSEVMP